MYIEEQGEAVDGFWKTRNDKIAASCAREAKKRGAGRVTVIYGIDHLYVLEENFLRLGFSEIHVPEKYNAAGQFRVSDAAVERWKRNLRNLEAALASTQTQPDIRRWIEESRRIEELKLFISKASPKGNG